MDTTAWQLPEISHGWVTDGGLETDLIFHRGIDLPDFAAFPLLEDRSGRSELESYYRDYARVAAKADAGLILETPTWRANADWGARLGYGADELRRVNSEAITWMRSVARDLTDVADVLVAGVIGPRGDGYRPSDQAVDEATEYHRVQLASFAEAGADFVTAYTLSTLAEAVGIVRAAADVNIPVAVSFTVETNGHLPDGSTLSEVINSLDNATGSAAAHVLVNCAHPDHIAPGIDADAGWTRRIAGLRVNASHMSHAELDEASSLDEGEIDGLAADLRSLAAALPALRIVGGCCGTDVRHVAAMWDKWSPVH
ncbi:homocysteine S-methyltransferase family protein [Gordonia crocea]|uniref:Homocysteine S-methyltransferase n=1 Tax=Gordonia crocea TaxID=589162 RepID=A0A7M3STU2_9ACTN|nr:homocysteine S-methyltransferase family protein [Gordonia crocea]GED96066.1 homocysteine S-methyltransferase [Gordonia crocea]